MVRTSHAFLAGIVAMVMVAIVAFIGGWKTSQAMGGIPLNTFVTTTFVSTASDRETPLETRGSFAVFWEVWDLVHTEFYHQEPLDQQRMVYGSIRGMLESLDDDYTIFQEPEAAERSRESMQGRFEGIGIYMSIEDGMVIVERPIKGAPAMEAGLESGDIIVKVDGVDIGNIIDELSESEAIDDVAERIRGPRGSTVTLSIRRPPATETFDVDIERDEVPLISVHAQMLEDNIAYIQVTEFKATTTDEFDEALRELLPQQPAGMVLDLRNNPGGFLTTAQEILGRFYEGVALYEDKNTGEAEVFNTRDAPSDVRVFDLPVVVLINGNSASASEIVAGALRDERAGATLLGETSFGKGSVQNIHRLSDGSSVRITIAQWLTPDMDKIDEVGITPEYIVPASQDSQYAVPCMVDQLPPEGQETCSDAQLSWGMRLLTSGETPPPPPTATSDE
jgi:carboxyl-terminal processing protease